MWKPSSDVCMFLQSARLLKLQTSNPRALAETTLVLRLKRRVSQAFRWWFFWPVLRNTCWLSHWLRALLAVNFTDPSFKHIWQALCDSSKSCYITMSTLLKTRSTNEQRSAFCFLTAGWSFFWMNVWLNIPWVFSMSHAHSIYLIIFFEAIIHHLHLF